VSLDYGLGRFFTRDGRYLICQTHSALYDPLSGLCVEGPCAGQKLRPIPLKVKDGLIYLGYKGMPSSTRSTGMPSRTG
jgi:nitrite reductase/ring-hydroxylating ferredoxin subunit